MCGVRLIVLVDGEHYPPVVVAALEHLPDRVPGAEVVAAALLGGTEKLKDGPPDLGVPVVTGDSPEAAFAAALAEHEADLVFDLSDEPIVDDRSRLGLVARALAAGIPYAGADFRFDPPPRPRVATKPTIAIVGTGKRTGKTSVSAHLARHLRDEGRPPVIVAMGRGGPDEPELIDPTSFGLTAADLIALADRGRHAASDHIEDAVMARVATIGTRRCGGGMAGAPVDSTFAGRRRAGQHPARRPHPPGGQRARPPPCAQPTPPCAWCRPTPTPSWSSGTSGPTVCC